MIKERGAGELRVHVDDSGCVASRVSGSTDLFTCQVAAPWPPLVTQEPEPDLRGVVRRRGDHGDDLQLSALRSRRIKHGVLQARPRGEDAQRLATPSGSGQTRI